MRLYNPELIWNSCRAFWKLESIEKHDVFEVCYYLDFFRISNNWDYTFSVSEENIELLNTMKDCNLQYWFTFSWGQLPKIWDTIYFTSEYWYNRITWFWKDVYDGNSNYVDCLEYIDAPTWSYNDPLTYKIITPCKVSWKIEEVARTFTDICWLNLGIKVKNWEETYIVWWREYFTWKGVSICLWGWNGEQQIDSTDWKITTQINKWDDFYAVLNQKDNTILRYWKNEYNADTSMSICSGATIKQIQSFKSWITESELIRIMKAVEKDVERSDPFHYNFGKWHNVWITKTLSWNTQSWTTNIDKKEESTKIVYVKPKTNTVKVYSPKQMITQNTENKTVDTNWETSMWTSTWKIKEQETISWSELKEVNTKNEKDEIITETKSVNSVNQEQSWNINYFWVIWIIIIILIVSMYLILKKTKK